MCGHISVQNNSWFRYSFELMLTVWEVTPRSVLSPPQKLSSAFILCFSSTYIYQKWSRSFQLWLSFTGCVAFLVSLCHCEV